MLETSIKHQTTLSANVVLLCRFLRNKGFSIGPTEEANAIQALTYLSIANKGEFKNALKVVLSKNKVQYLKFDDHYTEFWDQLSKASDAKIKDAQEPKQKKSKPKEQQARFDALKNWLSLKASKDEKETASFSDLEVLTKKNFADMSEDEMRSIMRELQKMTRKIARRKSRLRKVSKKHRHLDLRRTMRSSLRRGTDIQHLVFTEQKVKKFKLILLCDVSRSMELYSRFFVHLIYAFQNAHDRIETFVFSTALHRVSDILDEFEFDKAFDTISDRIPHWSGGTTIGSCLLDFARNYGRGMLDRKTIVFILSDGWDTGDPVAMSAAMKDIYKASRKVIWLNPLAGSPSFSPEALGMKTALPFIDVLASAHNLESLRLAMLQLSKGRNSRQRKIYRQ